MSREAELSERKNDELREILEEYGEPTYGNKDELVSRILHFELGVPEDKSDEDESDEPEAVEPQPDENGEAAVEETDDEDTPPEDAAPAVEPAVEESAPEEAAREADEPTEEPAEGEGEQALVKFLGGSGLHEAKGHRFSKEHPFGVLSQKDADSLTRKKPTLFRFARPSEADGYYS